MLKCFLNNWGGGVHVLIYLRSFNILFLSLERNSVSSELKFENVEFDFKAMTFRSPKTL